jgi:hypothetical protein
MGVGRAPTPPSEGVILVDSDVDLPDTQMVTVINPETGEPELVEVAITFGPGKAVGIVEDANGVEVFRLVGAFQDSGYPQSFLGFQTNALVDDTTRPIVKTARGARVEDPLVTDGVALVAGEDVFLSVVPGEVTQDPQYYDMEGSVFLRVGYAMSANKIALVPDFRVEL